MNTGHADDDAGPSAAERLDVHAAVSTSLALRSDRELAALLAEADALGSGVGGAASLLDVDGVPVFAKRVSLTDLERRPDNVMSTANLFDLPPFCQYGIGAIAAPGFGAWRELAANVMATNWVVAGRTEAFPLLHHWRVLPGAAPVTEEYADVEAAVDYWGGSAAVRQRLHALADATKSVVLFLEFVPRTLREWLADQVSAGDETTTAACMMLESRLLADVAFMNANGMLHFDAHLDNIVTDGHRFCFADLGLVTSSRFELSSAEAVFVAQNRSHDLCYAMMRLVNWLVVDVCGVGGPSTDGLAERNGYVESCAAGTEPVGAPDGIAAVIRRYAPVAAVMNNFYWDVFGVSRATPYPGKELERALADARPDLAGQLRRP